jgi:hypothetical protein
MSEINRYCCLLFDKMSITVNVRFNQKLDCIEGFEDLGSKGRTDSIANRALLFHGPWSASEVKAAGGLLPQLWKY